jgi:hypothetical protein
MDFPEASPDFLECGHRFHINHYSFPAVLCGFAKQNCRRCFCGKGTKLQV